MKINARKLALRILDEIENTHEFSHVVMNRTFQNYDIESADRRFISHIIYGVLENKLLLDYYIRKLSSERFTRIHPTTVNILRMGFYQIIYMSKVPESAAVDESVKLAKNVNLKDSKFVNGVLRQFLRMNKQIELPDRKKHNVTYLSIFYSFPEWLVKMWIEQYGEKFTEALLASSNLTPKLTLRVNTQLVSMDEFEKMLAQEGVEFRRSEVVPIGIIVENMNHLALQSLPGYQEGYFTVQDISSMCVGYYSGIEQNQTVIDLCAAPGGKTTHLAQLMHNTGKVLAFDNQESKIPVIEENVQRLKLTNVETSMKDALILDTSLVEVADLVLVDAPCSGLGIIRRKPDIKYNKSRESLDSLVQIQKEILMNAVQYVKLGGTLMYSTCTLNRAENQNVIEWLLQFDNRFELEPIDLEPYKSLFPNVHETDGFFIAKLIRKR